MTYCGQDINLFYKKYLNYIKKINKKIGRYNENGSV